MNTAVESNIRIQQENFVVTDEIEAIKKVSLELHNTVTVAKKSYCNSEIYETYLTNNEQFFEFIDSNRKLNGDKKSSDRMLTLFLIKYYKKHN